MASRIRIELIYWVLETLFLPEDNLEYVVRNLGIEPRIVSTGADLQSAVTNQQSPIPLLLMAEGRGIEPLPVTAALGSNQLCHLDATL